MNYFKTFLTKNLNKILLQFAEYTLKICKIHILFIYLFCSFKICTKITKNYNKITRKMSGNLRLYELTVVTLNNHVQKIGLFMWCVFLSLWIILASGVSIQTKATEQYFLWHSLLRCTRWFYWAKPKTVKKSKTNYLRKNSEVAPYCPLVYIFFRLSSCSMVLYKNWRIKVI